MTSKNDTLNEEENEALDQSPEKSGLSKIVLDFASSASNKLKSMRNDRREHTKIEKAFSAKCENYLIMDLFHNRKFFFQDYSIQGIRNAEPDTIYFKKDEKLLNKLISGTELVASSDNAIFTVLEKDMFKLVSYSLIIDGEEKLVDCYRVKVKLVEKNKTTKPPVPNVTNIQQSVVVHGDNSAPINQIVNVDEQLNKIEGDIKNCKDRPFSGKKKEAEKLFEEFKKCILSHKKVKRTALRLSLLSKESWTIPLHSNLRVCRGHTSP